MFDQDVFTNLRKVIKLLEKHDLEEIEIEQGDTALRVRRAGAAPVVSLQSPGVAPAAAAAAAPTAPAEKPKGGSGDGMRVVSPFVGTFYRASAPSEPAFVQEGDVVEKGQTLCIVEAMKLMNEIEAPVSGRIEAILVENEAAVEYGQEIFVISPR